MRGSVRLAIWNDALTVLAAYAAAIATVYWFVVAPRVSFPPLAIATSFALVQCGVIVLLLGVILTRKRRNVRRTLRTNRYAPEIREALAQHSIGIDMTSRIAELKRASRDDVRESALAFLATTTGEPHARLVALAERLGIEGTASTNAVELARYHIRERRFFDAIEIVAHDSLLARAIVTEELRPHAAEMDPARLLEALRGDDRDVCLTLLDMLRAWRFNLPLPGFTAMTRSDDPAIRARALLALLYLASVQPASEVDEAVSAGARDPDPSVRAAAAAAAAKLHVQSAAGALAENLTDADDEVARTSAFALAATGGSDALHRAILGKDRRAAAFALEAIEKAALGRLDAG